MAATAAIPRRAAPRVGSKLAEDSLDDRGCSVLGPDGGFSLAPTLPDPAQRWSEHLLDEVDDSGAFVGQPFGDLGRGGLIACQQRLIHAVCGVIEPNRFRRLGRCLVSSGPDQAASMWFDRQGNDRPPFRRRGGRCAPNGTPFGSAPPARRQLLAVQVCRSVATGMPWLEHYASLRTFAGETVIKQTKEG